MKVKIEPVRNGTWVVIALEGPLSNRELANVEGMQLVNVSFTGEALIGTPKAVWGATLASDIDADPMAVRGLGVGKPFHGFKGRKAQLRFREWIDSLSNKKLEHCQDVSVFRAGVFYR